VAPASTDVLGQTAPVFRDDDDRVLVPGEPLDGTIRPVGDVDTYLFDGAKDQTIRVTLTVTDGNLLPVIELRDAEDEVVAEARLRQHPEPPKVPHLALEATLPADDTFKIVVWGLDRTSGAYTLLMENVE